MQKAIKKVLVSHAEPATENSPYHQLANEFGLDIDFLSFVQIEGVATPEFRKQNINPLDFGAIIFTGKNAIDHFFRICADLRVEMPPDTKYFCVTESTANYLQKYIVIRKRKLFVAPKTTGDLVEFIKKHKNDKYLYPTGESYSSTITQFLETHKIQYKLATVYQTVPSDLTPVREKRYDLVCFFSPIGIEALFKNFPDFKQEDRRIAVFGQDTLKAAEAAGLQIDIIAPQPETPSMTMALEKYLRIAKASLK
ncbi:MAG: uroporphyrinogen-III synthase [Bacteroidetes bacterium]|nr:uroporphyrinogen-III synthase [Bacteroidota bacterium]